MTFDKKKLFPVLIPVICAVVVLVVFAVSGRVSVSRDDRVINQTQNDNNNTTAHKGNSCCGGR